jgi:hypothetical protein
VLALFVALGGSSYAALALPKNSVGAREIRTNGVTSKEVKNRTLKAGDFARGQLRAGPRGPVGPGGATGETGPPGENGSPDTPEQVLEKLKTVDGPNSALDADSIDGKNSGDLVGINSNGAANAVGANFYSYFMTTTSTDRYAFGQMAIQAAGAAGQFRICGNTGGPGALPWVLYLNGVRSTGNVNGNNCTAPFDAGAGGEFRVTIRRSIVFGVHSGDSPTNENYNIYGFGQL